MTESKTASRLLRAVDLAIGVIGAGAVLFVYWTGAAIDVQAERADLIAAIWRHVGYGAVLSPLVFAMIARNGPSVQRMRLGIASKTAFRTLAASLIFLIVSGPIVVWTHGSDLKIFDWFIIANPIGKTPAFHDWLEAAHGAVAHAAPWLLVVYAVLLAFAWMLRRKKSALIASP